MKRSLEFRGGTSSKFWTIRVSGKRFTVTYGRIGTDGQTNEKTFASVTEATAAAEKLVRRKLKKGYQEVGDASGASKGAKKTGKRDSPSAGAVRARGSRKKSATSKAGGGKKDATRKAGGGKKSAASKAATGRKKRAASPRSVCRWCYASSEGGPFIALDAEAYGQWEGVEGLHYERICEILGSGNTAVVALGRGLVAWGLPGAGTADVGLCSDGNELILASLPGERSAKVERRDIEEARETEMALAPIDVPSGLLVMAWAPSSAKEVGEESFGGRWPDAASLAAGKHRQLNAPGIDGIGALLRVEPGTYEIRVGIHRGGGHWCRLQRVGHAPSREDPPWPSAADWLPAACWQPKPEAAGPPAESVRPAADSPALAWQLDVSSVVPSIVRETDPAAFHGQPPLLCGDPRETAAWLFTEIDGRPALWRYSDEGFKLRARGDALPVRGKVKAACLYVDPKTAQPRVAMAHSGERAVVFTVDNGRFVTVEARNAPQVGRDISNFDKSSGERFRLWDTLAFDRQRGVLVHAGSDESRRRVVVHELQGDRWQEASETNEALYLSQRLFAGWDDARHMVVVVDDRGRAAGWDGDQWHKLARIPSKVDLAHLDVVHLWPHPSSGRLVLACWNRDKKSKTRAWLLEESKWIAVELAKLESAFGVATISSKLALSWAARRERGGLRHPVVELRPRGATGIAAHPCGSHALPAHGALAVHDGTAYVVGPQLAEYDWAVPSPQLAVVREKAGWVALEAIGKPLLGAVAMSEGVRAVTWSGVVHAVDASGSKKSGGPPTGFTPRRCAALGYLPEQDALLLTAGVSLGWDGKKLRQTWLWQNERWSRLKTTGKQPAFEDCDEPRIAWDPSRRAAVLVESIDPNPAHGESRTWELHEKIWHSFAVRADVPGHSVQLLASDPASGVLFVIANTQEQPGLWIYAGEGRWQHAARLTGVGGRHGKIAHALGYDPTARCLIAVGLEVDPAGIAPGLATLPIGELLDG